MATKNRAIRLIAKAVVFTTLFSMTIGAVLIAFIVRDWLFIQTSNPYLAGSVALFVVLGFLTTLGVGIGFYLWLRSTARRPETPSDQHEAVDRLLRDHQLTEHDRD